MFENKHCLTPKKMKFYYQFFEEQSKSRIKLLIPYCYNNSPLNTTYTHTHTQREVFHLLRQSLLNTCISWLSENKGMLSDRLVSLQWVQMFQALSYHGQSFLPPSIIPQSQPSLKNKRSMVHLSSWVNFHPWVWIHISLSKFPQWDVMLGNRCPITIGQSTRDYRLEPELTKRRKGT